MSRAKLRLLKSTNEGLYHAYGKTSRAVAVFPNVGKGGLIVGGAYGKGGLFEGGKVSGYCDVYEGTVGALVGGKAFTQFIFFQDNTPLLQFTDTDHVFDSTSMDTPFQQNPSNTIPDTASYPEKTLP